MRQSEHGFEAEMISKVSMPLLTLLEGAVKGPYWISTLLEPWLGKNLGSRLTVVALLATIMPKLWWVNNIKDNATRRRRSDAIVIILMKDNQVQKVDMLGGGSAVGSTVQVAGS